MPVKTIRDLKPAGKRVLVRVDFNVPLDKATGAVTDDLRIRAALPTIRFLLENNARVILMSHLGRPDGERDDKYSLRPVQKRLAELLGQPVALSHDCDSADTRRMADELEDGQVLLLENLRFHAGETKNNPDFAKALASLGELYVNDAFGTAHRAHASTEGIPRLLGKGVAGFLMEKELQFLADELAAPKRPFLAVLGGAKVSGKIDVITNLLDKVDAVLVGGGMIFTFFKAMGLEIGASLLEEDRIQLAADTLELFQKKGVELLLPVDVLVAEKVEAGAATRIVDREEMPAGWIGVDIGPRTRELFAARIDAAAMAVWNGPMGVFEIEDFAAGTKDVARALGGMRGRGGLSIVGGGDSAAAVKAFGLEDRFSHISTGGGASLELLEGRALPGVVALEQS